MNRLAILNPVYNAPRDLERTLRSVDCQKLPFDIYIVDDGSIPPVALEQTDYHHDIHVLTLPRHIGVATARNAGCVRYSNDPMTTWRYRMPVISIKMGG